MDTIKNILDSKLTKIATSAHKTTLRPSRKEQLTALIEMVKNSEFDNLPEDIKENIKTLYAGHFPNNYKPRKIKDDWKLITQFVAESTNPRYFLGYVNVDNAGYVQASTGYIGIRTLLPNAEGLEPGQYDPKTRVMVPGETAGKFPDLGTIIKKFNNFRYEEIEEIDGTVEVHTAHSGDDLQSITEFLCISEGLYVDKDLFDYTRSIMPTAKMSVCKDILASSITPLVFTTDTVQAILMPLRF